MAPDIPSVGLIVTACWGSFKQHDNALNGNRTAPEYVSVCAVDESASIS
jgi:hypothetical protein